MKVTKKMVQTIEKFIKIKTKEQELLDEIYQWMQEQGIDTFDDRFADAIAVRLGTNEFDSAEHLIEDLKKFKAGEHVGYG